jgi:hypothetical protein
MSSNLSSPSSFTVTPCYFTPVEFQSSLVAGNAPPNTSSRNGNLTATPLESPHAHHTYGLNGLEVSSPQPLRLPRVQISYALSPTSPGSVIPHQDGYFTARSSALIRNTQRQTTPSSELLASSTSEGVSPAVSPASLCQSCYSGQSLFSSGSIARLSPPPVINISSIPPYKPRSKNSVSLTMVPKRNRSQTLPLPGSIDDVEHGEKPRKHRHRRHHKRDGVKLTKDFEAQFPISFEAWNPHVEKPLSSHQRPPLISRRWSSFHSRHIEKQTLDTISEILSSGNSSVDDWKTKLEPIVKSHESDRKQSLIIVDDLIGTIRQMMTLRKIVATPMEAPEPPASITLRKASIPPTVDYAGQSIDLVSPNQFMSGAAEHTCPGGRVPNGASETYLITNEDIEAISRLVGKEIQNQTRKPVDVPANQGPPTFTTMTPAGNTVATSHDDDVMQTKPSSSQSSKSSRRKSIRKAKPELCRLEGPSRRPSQSSIRDGLHKVLFTQDQDSSGNSDDDMPAQFDFLHKGFSPPTPPPEISPKKPRKSTHEVIWKPMISSGGSPLKICKLPEDSYFTSEPASPMPITPAVTKREKDVADYLEAVHRTPSFFPGMQEWPPTTTSTPEPILPALPLVEPPKEFRTANESSSVQPRDSFKTTRQKKQSVIGTRRRPRLTVSETYLSELVDVISFPPLPTRKTTNDWKIPLPPIEMAPKPHGENLYDLGLDIHCGHSTTPSGSLNPNQLLSAPHAQHDIPEAPRKLVRSETLPHIEFKGAIQIQSKAPSLTSVSPEVGRSLETCPSDRKTSSAQVMRCVTTVDNARKAQKTGTWAKIRPDSICPPRRSPTPTELRPDLSIDTTSSPAFRFEATSPEAVDQKAARLAIIQLKMPQTPEVDRAGIYGRFTGTGNRNLSLTLCPGDYACEVVECHHCGVDTRNPSVDWIS